MVDKFLSDEESVLTKFENFYLTGDRVIKLKKRRGDRDYQDIQLEKITSFDYDREFNIELIIAGVIFSLIGVYSRLRLRNPVTDGLIALGVLSIIIGLLTTQKEYKIHSVNSEVNLDLPDSDEAVSFWKRINEEKNSE